MKEIKIKKLSISRAILSIRKDDDTYKVRKSKLASEETLPLRFIVQSHQLLNLVHNLYHHWTLGLS